MDLRLTFNEDATNYDQVRPTYPEQLYTDIINYGALGPDSRGLEIGVGTGQATAPFLELGCEIEAVELGDSLSRYVGQRYRGYPRFSVRNADFMECVFPPSSFHLVYSATAFHWLPAEAAYRKIHALLLPGGTVALFWNHPFPNREDDATNRANRAVYRKHRPQSAPPREWTEGDCPRRVEELKQFGFRDVASKLYRGVRTLSADAYLALLNTYSDHRALPQGEKAAFEHDMRVALDAVGGYIRIYDTVDLYLART